MSAEEPLSSRRLAPLAKMAASADTPLRNPPSSISAALLTPPTSMERQKDGPAKPLVPERGHKIPPPQFLTPSSTPTSPSPPSLPAAKLKLEEDEDLLTGLVFGGYRLLAERILDYLEPSDLYNSTLVCNTWSQIITSFPHLPIIIRSHTKQLRKHSENLSKPFPSSSLESNRKPLGDAKNRPPLTRIGQGGVTPSLPSKPSTIVPKRVMYKHRQCPQCKSISKQLNYRRAECTNTKCKYDFCSWCFRVWHDAECERQRSPKRPSTNDASVGSKRSKKNLRRL